MGDLSGELRKQVGELARTRYAGDPRLTALANEVVTDEADYEHIITFLDQSVSAVHRTFAGELREVFHRVLSERLRRIEEEQGGRPPVGLYAALLDMYRVPGVDEDLRGMLTLNYDGYIETAVRSTWGESIDLGLQMADAPGSTGPRLLKLHGSFDWHDEWPIAVGDAPSSLWIPPGIQKAKDRYPFNVLWGLARELLDCDVLRIVGCRIGANDWDLVSLLFTTRLTSSTGEPYRIEVIDSPLLACELKEKFPFLAIQSLCEVEPVGDEIVGALIGESAKAFEALDDEELEVVWQRARRGENWFRLWLKHMAEFYYAKLGRLDTAAGEFKRLLEA